MKTEASIFTRFYIPSTKRELVEYIGTHSNITITQARGMRLGRLYAIFYSVRNKEETRR